MASVNVPAETGGPFLCVGETSRLPSDPPSLVVRSITNVGRGEGGGEPRDIWEIGERHTTSGIIQSK